LFAPTVAFTLPQMHRTRRNRPTLSRFAWIGVLLLAAVFKPAIVMASELHEAVHWIEVGHAHDADVDGPGIPLDERDQGQAPDADGRGESWHVLMHQGHCCGMSFALLVSHAHVRAVTGHVAPAPAVYANRPGVRLPRPLRPPIAG
jgi:hypothetical protein